jgi:hypothetical protein
MKNKTLFLSILAVMWVFAATQSDALGMGRGMTGGMGGGYGMGPGMMNRGWGAGPQYGTPYAPGYQGPPYNERQRPMDQRDAKELLENYLRSTRNPNLKLGPIVDKGDRFEAEIQTRNGSLVDRIIVDKRTGSLQSAY